MLDQYTSLKNYEEFIKIMDGNRPYYGGDQGWFLDKKNRKYGCAAVVGANITAYLSEHNGNERLYPYDDFSIKSYINHMEEVVKYIEPVEKVGILRVSQFKDGVENYAKSRGVSLKGRIMVFENGYSNIYNFIKESLESDTPVGMLILRNDVIKEFDYHWMTITKLYKNQFDVYVSVSSWGEKRLLKLKDIYNYSSYGSLVSFI